MKGPGLHILVVEDNPGDFVLLEDQLQQTPIQLFKIIQAESLERACLWLKEFRFDLVLLDLSLPDSNGLETFRKIFPLAGQTPIVVLSGLSDFEIALDSVRLGVQDYLVKGDFDEKMLYKVISHSLERKRQLDKIEDSERKYKHLFESNPQPMWIHHQNTHAILAVNHSTVAHYGYSLAELLEMELEDLLDPKEYSRMEVWRVQPRPDYCQAGIWLHRTKKGETIHVNLLVHSLTFENQPACLVLAQDVTATVLAEQEKNHLIQELMKNNDHLQQFTYIVSHNLRAPVANLMGLCQMLETEQEDVGRLLGMVHQSAQRLDDVILQLNKTLAIQKGLRHQVYVTVQLNKVLNDVLDACQPQMLEAGGICYQDLQLNEFSVVYSYLYSLLENLISNAIKYRAPERQLEIWVRSRQEGEQIVISVDDNGLGLPERFLETYAFGMYKRFYSHVEGKGLGLFMCKNQVEALGGRIDVQSKVGSGTTFQVFLPLSLPKELDA